MKLKLSAMPVAAVVAGLALLVGACWVYSWFPDEYGRLLIFKDQVSSATLVQNLSSPNANVVNASLGILAERRDPLGRDQASGLLESKEEYWFSSAIYLGTLGDARSVPHLIKLLRYPATYRHAEAIRLLREMTGQDFGRDQGRWIAWWRETHPQASFDFRFPEAEVEALRLSDRGGPLITGVLDAMTVRHFRAPIRLIGVKPKKGQYDENAMRHLSVLVLDQVVELQFDGGPLLDEHGSRRAFVFWWGSSRDAGSRARDGLPPVPFKEGRPVTREQKPLINRVLLESGLYEPDPASVESEAMRALLFGAGKEKRGEAK